ncbi:MAG: PEGA domain-containing protein [Myxococcales bacterium]|nr:PEGA domain-containing protein [Myxococcales bacterium]
MPIRRNFLFVVLAVALTTVASAAPPGKVLVLKPQSESVGEPEKEAALTHLRGTLAKYPGTTLVETPKSDLLDDMMELECTDVDEDCFVRIGKKYGADQVVYTELAPAGGGIAVKLRLVDVASKTTLKSHEGTAKVKADLSPTLVDALAVAFGALPAEKPPEKPKDEKFPVDFTSSPAGATVLLNGVKIGVVPLSVRLKPGKYKATVSLEGHETISDREIVVTAAGPNTAAFDLSPIAKVPELPPEKHGDPEEDTASGAPFYKTWWFWTAIGVAVVGTTVGLAVGLSDDEEAPASGVLQFGFGNPDLDPAVRGVQR